MNEKDIFEYLIYYCNGNKKDIIEVGRDLMRKLATEDFLYSFNECLEEFSRKNDICSKCGADLEMIHSDYFSYTFKGKIFFIEKENFICKKCN